jgi:polysaccharide export outer membrane protein
MTLHSSRPHVSRARILGLLCNLAVAITSLFVVPSATAFQTSTPALVERHPRYLLRPQDVVLLTFALSPELNQTLTIQPDGYINLQNAGSLYAQGMSAPQLAAAVKLAYQGILHDPIVDVDVQDFQKPLFTVSGQVGKPGQYELRSDITVAQALAVAGGMTMATARTQVFLFHRTNENLFEVRKVNLKQILRGQNVNEDPPVGPGDMIYVPEKFISNFRKYVPYALNAGSYLQANPL